MDKIWENEDRYRRNDSLLRGEKMIYIAIILKKGMQK